MLTMTLIAWQASTETTLTSTNATNIFIPVGQMIFGADYATLKIVINITQIFEETREVCHLSDAIEELINGRTKDISDPNKKVLDVVTSSYSYILASLSKWVGFTNARRRFFGENE